MVTKQKSKKNLLKGLGVMAFLVATFPAAQSYAASDSVSWLGLSPSFYNYAHAIDVSADGSVVVLSADVNNRCHAFRWTESSGMTDLGTLRSVDLKGKAGATGVNADGSVIVGVSDTNDIYQHAFRWTQNEGLVDLGTLIKSNTGYSYAYGVSADGSVIVGGAWAETEPYYTYEHAFRWTQGVMKDLGTLRTKDTTGTSEANAVSADGAVVVGVSDTNSGGYGFKHAFRWTESEKMKDLGTLRTVDATGESTATSVNADGSVIVGYSASNIGADFVNSRAFRWTQGEGMKDLGTMRTADTTGYSCATDVNADGSVVVGYSVTNTDGDLSAFRWTQASGMISVGKWLENNGVANAQNLKLVNAYGVSADGNVIVGSGYLNGEDQAYVARINGIIGMQDFYNSITPLQSINKSLENSLQYSLANTFDLSVFGENNFGISVNGKWDHDSSRSIVMGKRSVEGKLRYGVGYNRLKSRTDLLLDGDANSKGNMFGSFVNYGLPNNKGLQAHLSFAFNNGDVGIKRMYLAGNEGLTSIGNPEYKQRGVMLDVGYGKDVSANTLIMPHIGIVSTKTELDRYTEQGGNFPAEFGKRESTSTYAKIGINSTTKIGKDNIRLHANVNRMQHISGSNDAITGQIIGLSSFEQEVLQAKSFNEYNVGVDISLGNEKAKQPAFLSMGVTKLDGANVDKEKTYNLGFKLGF